MVVLGCLSEPACGTRVILRYALAVSVENAELVLGRDVVVLGQRLQ